MAQSNDPDEVRAAGEHPEAHPDAHLREEPLAEERVWQGKLLDVRRATVRLPSGAEATREFIQHPGAVMVVPLLDDEHAVMERQHRHPVGHVLLEFPAGKLDPGEGGFETAKRELLEETGYRAREWLRLGMVHTACAYSTEGIELWLARGLVAGERALDDGEFLDVLTQSVDQLDAGVARGDVTDVKTIAGLWWWQRWLRGRVAGTWLRDPDAEALARRLAESPRAPDDAEQGPSA